MVDTSARKSTIDRAAIPTAPVPIRAAFRALDLLAPGLAARWAGRLWFTVPPASAASRRPGPAGGEPFELDVDGHRVVGQCWGSGPTVYLVHGWGGWGTQLGAFVEPLVAAGHQVVTFDAPGHGRSEPGDWRARRTNILEFGSALTAVVAAHGPAHAVIGHSLGCGAVAVAIRDGLTAGRLVFLAPMAHPANFVPTIAKILGLGWRTQPLLAGEVERRVGRPMSDFDVPAIATQVATPPLLVVHDRDDAETRHRDGEAIAASWPEAELVTTTGLGHRRLVRDPDVVARAVTFVDWPAAGRGTPPAQGEH